MSRWFDADEVEKLMKCGCAYAIWKLPSIDLVRCGECKYEPICNHGVQHTTHDAHSVTMGYKSIDFCSYGERKENE